MSTELKKHFANWSPVIVKGAMWIISSMLIAFLAQIEHLTPDKIQTWTWVDFSRMPVQVVLAGLATAMAFMDQIIARHKEQLEAEGKIPPPPNVEIKPQS